MAFEWPRRTFGDLISAGELEIGDGYRAKNDELATNGTGLIFLRAGHVSDSHIDFSGVERFVAADGVSFGAKVSEVGDVIVTTKGNSTGRVAFVSQAMPRFVYSPHLSYWRATSKGSVRQDFLRAWSRSGEFARQLHALSRSTDMAPYLSLRDQRRLVVTIPPERVQALIGQMADALSDRIDLLRQTNATLEAIAQALFKSWFVDFDPVRAKAEGREPEGMDAATAALFPSAFEESELGLIPKGWTPSTFGSVAKQCKGTVNPLRSPTAEFDHYSLPAFDAGMTPFIELGEAIKSNKTPVPSDAVLISKLNPHIPRIWFVGEARPNAVCSTEFLVWRPASGFSPEYVYCLALSGKFNSGMKQLVTGTSNSHQRVKPDHLSSIPVVAPLQTVANAFGEVVGPLIQRVLQNRTTAQALAAVRDTLLPRLISGKLRLPEVEAAAAEVSA